MTQTPTPLQKKIINLKESIRQIRHQQNNMTAFIDCLALNLDAISEQVGHLENSFIIENSTRKEK